MQFQLGDFVEPIYCPGAHRMVVEVNPVEPEPWTTPHPCVVVGWREHNGKYREACVEAKYLVLIFRAVRVTFADDATAAAAERLKRRLSR